MFAITGWCYHIAKSVGVTTLNEQNVTVSINAGVVKIDKATMTVPNILAANGVVHEIDAVMVPTVFDAPNCGTSGSVAQLAVATPDLWQRV